jgi:hypothetical protein
MLDHLWDIADICGIKFFQKAWQWKDIVWVWHDTVHALSYTVQGSSACRHDLETHISSCMSCVCCVWGNFTVPVGSSPQNKFHRLWNTCSTTVTQENFAVYMDALNPQSAWNKHLKMVLLKEDSPSTNIKSKKFSVYFGQIHEKRLREYLRVTVCKKACNLLETLPESNILLKYGVEKWSPENH